jgi:hypothetical protein
MSELAPKALDTEDEHLPEYSDVTTETMAKAIKTDRELGKLTLRNEMKAYNEGDGDYRLSYRTNPSTRRAAHYRGVESARQTIASKEDPELDLQSRDRVITMLDDAYTEDDLRNRPKAA